MDKLEKEMISHKEAVNTIKFTADGNFCMTASSDRTVKLWNPHRSDVIHKNLGFLIKTYSGIHGYGINDVTISSDNFKYVSAGGDKTCFLIDVSTGRAIRRIQAHHSYINSVDFNDDATVVASGSYDRTVCLWDLRASSRDPLQILGDFKDSVTSIIHTRSAIIAGSIDSTVRTYDMRRGLMHTDDMCAPVLCVRLTRDEKCVIATCLGSTIKMLDLGTGRILSEYSGGHINTSYKLEACVSSDDGHLLVCSEDGSLCHYNILTGKMVRKTEYAHSKSLSAVVCHPTDSIVLTSSYDGTAKCWRSDPYTALSTVDS